MSSEVDARIGGRFELIALAGSGGMGRVYRARDSTTGELVALKLLSARGDADRLAREARLLASLDHPAVVRYVSAGETDEGTHYLVMEWLSGHDLDDRLSRGPLSVDEVIVLAKRIAGALAASHARGLIHRDIKPANIFLVEGDVERAKLIDFGLARQHDDAILTAEGAVVGTPAFMPPEQIRGERVDVRADIYAFGALLFACLIGRPPFAGAHGIAVLAKAVAEPAPRLSDLRLDVPDALDALVDRLLSKEREHRPADAAQLVRELEALAQGPQLERRAPVAITTQEQRVACVVLCDASARREEQTVVEPSRKGTLSGGADASSSGPGVASVVEDLGGTFHALTRDTSLVTVRGAATPAEQAARAARCALAISSARPGAPLVVATGRVVKSGNVEVGEVIDRASGTLVTSLRGGAPAIVVDEPTADLLGDRFIVRGEGPWRELVGEQSEVVVARTFLGRPAPCVGRASEVATLESALTECIAEPRSRAVLIVAPPGVGKSRLVQELRARVSAGMVADVLSASADPVRAGSSFGMVAQLLRRRANISDEDAQAVKARKLRAMVERMFAPEDVDRLEAFLGEIAGAYASSDAAPPELRAARADAAMMADVMREAWVEWVRALTDRRALVIVLEDLHWSDPASVRLMDAVLDELRDRPLLVVGTARPEIAESMPDLWRKRALQEIHLGPLPARAARAFVEGTLGPSAEPAVVDALVSRAAGHPFYLEELVRAVASGRGADALPDSILGMIQARLDQLDAGARRVLRAASVFGYTFVQSGVEALLGLDAHPREIVTHVRGLHERELIQRRTSARQRGEVEYAFRHALLRDAAYAMLTDQDKTLAHRLAGEFLEGAGETDPAVLADHFDRGGSPARALQCYRRAAKAALARSDLERAAAFAARGLACGPDEAARGALWAIESEVSYWRGDLDAASTRASDAAEKLPSGSGPWFDAASAAIGALGQRGKNDEVAAWLKRVAEAESSEESRGAHVVALCRGFTQLAWAHHWAPVRPLEGGPQASAPATSGELELFRGRLEKLAEPIDELSPYEAGWVHRVRAEAAWLFDRDVDACLGAFDASERAFERAHALRFLCLTRMNHASLGGWSGNLADSLDLVATARATAERFGWNFLASYALAVTGMLEVFSGRPEGEATIRSALAALSGSPRLAFICRVLIGWAALDRGDIDDAEMYARAAIETPAVAELRPAGNALLARVLRARGLMDLALERARMAAEAQRAAHDLELFEGLPDVALAEVHEARGDLDAARDAVAEGHRRLASIAATIASPERRASFWARRVANDRLHSLAARFELVPPDAIARRR